MTFTPQAGRPPDFAAICREARLTRMQGECARLVALGCSYNEIARRVWPVRRQRDETDVDVTRRKALAYQRARQVVRKARLKAERYLWSQRFRRGPSLGDVLWCFANITRDPADEAREEMSSGWVGVSRIVTAEDLRACRRSVDQRPDDEFFAALGCGLRCPPVPVVAVV